MGPVAPDDWDNLDPKLKSYNPKVSLDPSVYYKTQQATYERLETGTGRVPKCPRPKSTDDNLLTNDERVEKRNVELANFTPPEVFFPSTEEWGFTGRGGEDQTPPATDGTSI